MNSKTSFLFILYSKDSINNVFGLIKADMFDLLHKLIRRKGFSTLSVAMEQTAVWIIEKLMTA